MRRPLPWSVAAYEARLILDAEGTIVLLAPDAETAAAVVGAMNDQQLLAGRVERFRERLQQLLEDDAGDAPFPPPKTKKRRTDSPSEPSKAPQRADAAAEAGAATQPEPKEVTDAPAAPQQLAVTETPANPTNDRDKAAAADLPHAPAAAPIPATAPAAWGATGPADGFGVHLFATGANGEPLVSQSTGNALAICAREVHPIEIVLISDPRPQQVCPTCLKSNHPAAASLRTWFALDPQRPAAPRLHAVPPPSPSPKKARGATT